MMIMADTIAIDSIAEALPEFPELVSRYQRMVFSIAYHFLYDRSMAEEVAQDVFLQLYCALPSIKSEEHATAWLYKVAGHRCIDYARRRRRDLTLDEIPEPSSDAHQGDPLMARRLQKLVASLPPKARIVVVLRYQEELEPEEIARALGWRLNTVKSQLHRSLDMLRKKLGSAFGDYES
jgi:RNA polymerase sigma-70 factor, ECF subfamily